jgi:hypothetical protein
LGFASSLGDGDRSAATERGSIDRSVDRSIVDGQTRERGPSIYLVVRHLLLALATVAVVPVVVLVVLEATIVGIHRRATPTVESGSTVRQQLWRISDQESS